MAHERDGLPRSFERSQQPIERGPGRQQQPILGAGPGQLLPQDLRSLAGPYERTREDPGELYVEAPEAHDAARELAAALPGEAAFGIAAMRRALLRHGMAHQIDVHEGNLHAGLFACACVPGRGTLRGPPGGLVQDRLLFLIGSPRSGSTLLARMLGAHPKVFAPPEPHLITPLAHLGYYASVEKAPYDPNITREAARALIATLPRGEADYLDALRASTDTLYARLLAGSGAEVLLDKTPAYALVLDFLSKLYPRAHYVVLTRHPMAVWSSYVDSFFDGDFAAAHAHNPLLERYVPAVARFLRERPVPFVHVRYEAMVKEPKTELERMCAHIGLDFHPGMVEYGREERAQPAAGRGLGDPITVAKETRPTTRSIAKWAQALSGNAARVEQSRRILSALDDADLETWGHARAEIEAQLDAVPTSGPKQKPPRLDRYRLERRLLVLLRKNIHHNAFGRLVKRVRTVCDVLLR